MILLLFADENKIDTFYKPFKIESMEVVTIEKRTFSYVCERFTEFAKRIESLCSTHTQKVENWLDSHLAAYLQGGKVLGGAHETDTPIPSRRQKSGGQGD